MYYLSTAASWFQLEINPCFILERVTHRCMLEGIGEYTNGALIIVWPGVFWDYDLLFCGCCDGCWMRGTYNLELPTFPLEKKNGGFPLGLDLGHVSPSHFTQSQLKRLIEIVPFVYLITFFSDWRGEPFVLKILIFLESDPISRM